MRVESTRISIRPSVVMHTPGVAQSPGTIAGEPGAIKEPVGELAQPKEGSSEGSRTREGSSEGSRTKEGPSEELRLRGYIPTEEACKRTSYGLSGFYRAIRVLGIKGIATGKGHGARRWFSEADIDRILKAKDGWKKKSDFRERGTNIPIRMILDDVETPENMKAAFTAFRAGKSVVDLIIETGMAGLVADQLWKRWLSLTGAIWIPAEDLKFLARFPWESEAPITSARNLKDAVRMEFAVKARETKCLKCGQRPKKLCEHCFKASIEKVQATYIGLKPIGSGREQP